MTATVRKFPSPTRAVVRASIAVMLRRNVVRALKHVVDKSKRPWSDEHKSALLTLQSEVTKWLAETSAEGGSE